MEKTFSFLNLSDKQKIAVFDAVVLYANGEKCEVDDVTAKLAFDAITKQIDDCRKIIEANNHLREIRRACGKKGGAPRGNKNALKKNRPPSDTPHLSEDTPKNQKPKVMRFIPPTIEEVKAYCQEKGYMIEAENFCDFYQSKGWKVGTSQMKDWKAAVRQWMRRDSRTAQDTETLKTLRGYAQVANAFAQKRENGTVPPNIWDDM